MSLLMAYVLSVIITYITLRVMLKTGEVQMDSIDGIIAVFIPLINLYVVILIIFVVAFRKIGEIDINRFFLIDKKKQDKDTDEIKSREDAFLNKHYY